jgi:DNA-binding CsgD family transcriptional regulator
MQHENKDVVNEIKNNRSGNCLLCAVSFAAYSFLASLSAMETNAAVAGFYGAEHAPLFYSFLLLSTAAGFAVFGITQIKMVLHDNRIFAFVSGILFAISMILIYLLPTIVPIFIPALLSPFVVGALGCLVYYRAADVLHGNKHLGIIIGGAYSVSVFVQFLVQNTVPHNIARMFILIALFCCVIPLNMRIPDMFISRNGDSDNTHGKSPDRSLWIIAATVFVVALMIGVYDGMAAEFSAAQKMNLAGWPRLLLGLGTVAAGYLFDIGHRQYLNILILCAAIVNTVNVLLLSTAHTYVLSQVLMYSSMGFFVLYLMVSFIEVAPDSPRPAIWAGAGRISYLIAMAVTTSLTGLLNKAPAVVLDIIMMVLLLVIFLMFAMNGMLSVGGGERETQTVLSQEERVRSFAGKFKLTPRETEVLKAVSSNEKTLAAIASEMGISERVLQRHLSSIYKKTGTQTRNGLTLALHGIKSGS